MKLRSLRKREFRLDEFQAFIVLRCSFCRSCIFSLFVAESQLKDEHKDGSTTNTRGCDDDDDDDDDCGEEEDEDDAEMFQLMQFCRSLSFHLSIRLESAKMKRKEGSSQ